MVFGPPQHGPLGWLTAPPSADTLRASVAVSTLHPGLSPTTPYRNFRQPVRVCTPNGGDLTPMVVHIKGRAFLPSPKGAASRSHIGDTSPAAGFRIRAEEQDPSRGTRASRGDRSHRRSSPPTICLRPVAVATAAAQRPSRDEGSCASNRTDNGRVAHCAETLKRGWGLRSRAARNRRRSATGARGWRRSSCCCRAVDQWLND